MSTKRAIRLEIGRVMRDKDPQAFMEFVNTGTSTSQITDATNLASSRYTTQTFQDRYVRWSDATAAAPDGEKVYARTLTPSTGILTVSPSFTGTPASGDVGELWKEDPDNVDRAIDRALTQLCTRWRLTPLSYVQDPDFLIDDLADATPTNWVGSSATATVTNRSGMERFSERVLRTALSGANGYAGQTVNAISSESWVFAALAQADVGTATPVIQDLTNAAALTLTALGRSTWAGEAFQLIKFTFDTSSTTEQISVRLGGSGASDDIYWGPVVCYPQDATEFVLPPRITNRTLVGTFYEYIGDDYPERNLIPLRNQPTTLDVGGGNVRVVFNDGPVGQRVIFYEEFANYAALQSTYNTQAARAAADALTTDCPLEYVVWAAMRELLGAGAVDAQYERVHRKHRARPRVRFGR